MTGLLGPFREPDLANWNWKVVRRFVQERFGHSLTRSSCLNYLHRLGFVLKRPKKHGRRSQAGSLRGGVLLAEAQQVGAKVFFADEAHFRADADLRGKWVLKGEPALVDSSSPRWGEKASYYSAVCLETGEVDVMELQGYSNAETSTAFLKQLRDKHAGPLNVIWDNAPVHHGDALRAYLTTPGLRLRFEPEVILGCPSSHPNGVRQCVGFHFGFGLVRHSNTLPNLHTGRGI